MNERYTLIPNEVLDILIGSNLSTLEHNIAQMLISSTYGKFDKCKPVSLKKMAYVFGETMWNILTACANLGRYNVVALEFYHPENSAYDSILLSINMDWKTWKIPKNNWRGNAVMNEEVKEMAKQIIGEVIDSENSYIVVNYRNGFLEIRDIGDDEEGIDFSENLYEIEPEYMAEEVVIVNEHLKSFISECEEFHGLYDEE